MPTISEPPPERTTRVRLIAQCEVAGTRSDVRVSVFDCDGGLIARGPESIEVVVPRDMYVVRVDRGSLRTDRMIDLRERGVADRDSPLGDASQERRESGQGLRGDATKFFVDSPDGVARIWLRQPVPISTLAELWNDDASLFARGGRFRHLELWARRGGSWIALESVTRGASKSSARRQPRGEQWFQNALLRPLRQRKAGATRAARAERVDMKPGVYALGIRSPRARRSLTRWVVARAWRRFITALVRFDDEEFDPTSLRPIAINRYGSDYYFWKHAYDQERDVFEAVYRALQGYGLMADVPRWQDYPHGYDFAFDVAHVHATLLKAPLGEGSERFFRDAEEKVGRDDEVEWVKLHMSIRAGVDEGRRAPDTLPMFRAPLDAAIEATWRGGCVIGDDHMATRFAPFFFNDMVLTSWRDLSPEQETTRAVWRFVGSRKKGAHAKLAEPELLRLLKAVVVAQNEKLPTDDIGWEERPVAELVRLTTSAGNEDWAFAEMLVQLQDYLIEGARVWFPPILRFQVATLGADRRTRTLADDWAASGVPVSTVAFALSFGNMPDEDDLQWVKVGVAGMGAEHEIDALAATLALCTSKPELQHVMAERIYRVLAIADNKRGEGGRAKPPSGLRGGGLAAFDEVDADYEEVPQQRSQPMKEQTS